MDGELPALPGERADHRTTGRDHLNTLFPEVRLKNYLEMRGADTGPPERLCALAALLDGPALRRRRHGRRLGPRASTGRSRTTSGCAPTPRAWG